MSGTLQSLNWDDLKLFSAVARTGNFTRAAQELRLTGVTVGRRMQRLERDLGVKLFAHSGNDAHLTDNGRRVLAHVSAAEFSITQASAPAPREGSVCRIMCSDGLSSYWFPQFLPPFLDRHPNIDLAIFNTPDRYSARPPLFDLKIQYTESGSEDLVCARAGTMHFTLFASRRYLRSYGDIAQLSDLAGHRVLELALDITGQGNLATWTKLSFRNALLTNMNGTLSETLRWGGGIGLLPSFAGLFERSVVPVLPSFRLPVSLFICYDRENAKRPAVRTALDYLRDTVFDQNSMPWFRDTYVPPDKLWPDAYRGVLATLYPKSSPARSAKQAKRVVKTNGEIRDSAKS
jgi:DNA-binding transcriptional LysR family regulator